MQARILKFVPSRIGEPLTTVAVSQDLVLFGSISGYIGLCYFRENKVIFDDVVIHSSIIRDSWIAADQETISFAVGDEYIVVAPKGENKHIPAVPFDYKRLVYGGLPNAIYTPAMISFVREKSAFLGYFPTPTCERPCTLLLTRLKRQGRPSRKLLR